MLPEATAEPNSVTIPDKTSENTPDGTDKTPKQLKTELPDTTSNVSPDVTKANTAYLDATETNKTGMEKPESDAPVDEKPSKGRSKDPRTFKCSVCSTRTATLCE